MMITHHDDCQLMSDICRRLREVLATRPKYIIIDTQGGPEDIVALVVAIGSAQREGQILLGITTTNGRRSLQLAIRDALLACKLANAYIPIYKGSEQSIILNSKYPACNTFSNDYSLTESLCDRLLTAQDEKMVKEESAVLFISECIRKYERELAIITFGPLTNIALAYHANTDIVKINHLHINGGQVKGVGNVVQSYMSEGNFYYDPHAASIVLKHYKRILLNPIERTIETCFKAIFTKMLEAAYSEEFKEILRFLLSQKYTLCGPLLTVFPALKEECLKRYYDVYGEVVMDGNITEGLLAIDWLRTKAEQGAETPNLKIQSSQDFSVLNEVLYPTSQSGKGRVSCIQ